LTFRFPSIRHIRYIYILALSAFQFFHILGKEMGVPSHNIGLRLVARESLNAALAKPAVLVLM